MAKFYQAADGTIHGTPEAAKKKRSPTRTQRDQKTQKITILNYLKKGLTIKQALLDIGITEAQYMYMRQSDASFREDVEKLKLIAVSGETAERNRQNIAPFPQWCEDYLDTKLFWHHLQWYDMLERREPRNLHEAQQYIKGDPDFLMINTPPEHAKTTTITVNYVTYRICQDPNIRVILVSNNETLAKRFLQGIKDRLASDNRNYQKLQVDFGPEGGFDADSASWSATQIYVSSQSRDSGEPTPTVQAIGLGGSIYGNRADLIILDDCIINKNAHEYAKQMHWLQTEVYSRLADPGGQILLVGTRLAPVDLYGEIMKPEYYGDEDPPWTYLTQPAVLEFDEDPDKWLTLWPKSNRPPVSAKGRAESSSDSDGMWDMWTGRKLLKKRRALSPRAWALTYQQEQFSQDSIFHTQKVNGCVDGMRPIGPMQPGQPPHMGHRENGMAGTYVIGGFDPAMSGHSASVVMAVDRQTGVRWIVDVWTKGNLKPEDIFSKIKELTMTYNINEWRIEKNAMNMMVTQDRDINQFLRMRGVLLREHFTGANKWDADFGVASMSGLFENHDRGQHLIHLPRKTSEGVKALVEQLTTWEPTPPGQRTKRKTDCVMALWFAEIAARDIIQNSQGATFSINNPYLSARDKAKQMTIDLNYYEQGQGSWQ